MRVHFDGCPKDIECIVKVSMSDADGIGVSTCRNLALKID
jgi:hypothetical protein